MLGQVLVIWPGLPQVWQRLALDFSLHSLLLWPEMPHWKQIRSPMGTGADPATPRSAGLDGHSFDRCPTRAHSLHWWEVIFPSVPGTRGGTTPASGHS